MQIKTYISTLVALSISLSLTACASTPPQNSSSTLYSFPDAIEDGYWAMVGEVNGEYTVVDFKDGITNNYRFKCDNTTHSYQKIGKETYTLKPTAEAMQLIHDDSIAFATLKVAHIEPQKVLFLTQSFLTNNMHEALPNGIEFAYIYTKELKPLCGS